MKEPRTVYCPMCGRKVGVYDGKSSTNLITRCNTCMKQVVYDIETEETRTKPLPSRQTSSGMIF